MYNLTLPTDLTLHEMDLILTKRRQQTTDSMHDQVRFSKGLEEFE
jgi:hypothetical protein